MEGKSRSPKAPPFPGLNACRSSCQSHSMALESTQDRWDQLFAQGYRADVCVNTSSGVIPAHGSILGMASPVMKQMLKQPKGKGGRRKSITIRGVPHQAVRVFLRFLYSSCYEKEEMNQYILHLLVLSHAFAIPSLKKVCVQQLEKGLISVENVIDIFQLGRLCDAPRLTLLCHRMIVRDFQAVSVTEGWKVMRQSDPKLEMELLETVVEADSKKKERMKKMEERKIYLQLLEAMEALVHICIDGCRTIGPHDKALKRSAAPCNFPACSGVESLVRHFAACKKRVLGGCGHCKRMWQLLELHSRLCEVRSHCKVPLCSHFNEKIMRRGQQGKKEEAMWKLLVGKVVEARSYSAAAPAKLCAAR